MRNDFWRSGYALLGLMIATALTGLQVLANTALVAPANFPPPRLQSLLDLAPDTATARALSIKGWKTLTGTKVLFIHTTAMPMFDLHVSFAAGSAWDGDMPGLAAATMSMLTEGVPGKDLPAIVETFDGLGAQLTMTIDHDRADFALRSLSHAQKRAPALELLGQILGEPLLTEGALKRVKNELRDELKAKSVEAGNSPEHAIKTMLAPHSSWSLPFYGTERGLQTVNRAAVQNFHRRFYRASHAQITLVGSLTLEEAKALSLQISDALPVMSAGTPATPMPTHDLIGTETSRHEEQSLTQTHLLLGQPSVSRQHPDYAALYAANLIFGGSPNSRLMNALREKHGLVYDASSQNTTWATAGLMTISLQVSASLSQATLALTEALFSDFLRDGPTEQEVAQIKLQVANMSALTSASNRQILRQLVEINRHDLPLDLDYTAQQIQRLTPGMIHEALNRHWAADRWRRVTIGATVRQQPLPTPSPTPPSAPSQSMCRAEAGFVAS